jgi:hypothetical protein
VVSATTAATFSIPLTSGHKYLIERSSAPFTSLSYAEITGSPATADKHFGPVKIGLDFANLAGAFNNVGITAASNTGPGNIDGGGASLSQTAMTAAGAAPGATITVSGLTFKWPASAGTGTADNVVASGQTILLSGSGATLGFLVTGTYGPATGTGTITYTDGTTQSYTLSSPDWFGSTGVTVAIDSAYQNRQGNTTYAHQGCVYFLSVPLTASKTLASVQLPDVSAAAVAGTPTLHVFSLAVH